eukprot:1476658-Heterocapsa_arctica.AAC.1
MNTDKYISELPDNYISELPHEHAEAKDAAAAVSNANDKLHELDGDKSEVMYRDFGALSSSAKAKTRDFERRAR